MAAFSLLPVRRETRATGPAEIPRMTFPTPQARSRRLLFPVLLSLGCGAAAAQTGGPAETAGQAAATGGAQAVAPAWRLRLHSDRHSDVLTLKEVGDEAYEQARPRGRHNIVYADEEVRLGRRLGDWHVDLLVRDSFILTLDRDAVEVVARAADGGASRDQRWQPSARLRAFVGAGVELGRDFALGSQWRLGWSAQALALTRLQERRFSGQVSYEAARDRFSVQGQLHTVNDRLKFPFQTDFAPRGAGLLFGAELGWDGGQGFSATLSAQDAGWLRWRGLPRQDARIASNATERDADGFLIYKPLLEGRNSQDTYSAYWPARWALRGAWQATADTSLSASVQAIPGLGTVLPGVGVQQRWTGDVVTSLGWRFHERRALAAVGWKGWRLELGADTGGAASRHSRVLGLSYGMPW